MLPKKQVLPTCQRPGPTAARYAVWGNASRPRNHSGQRDDGFDRNDAGELDEEVHLDPDRQCRASLPKSLHFEDD